MSSPVSRMERLSYLGLLILASFVVWFGLIQPMKKAYSAIDEKMINSQVLQARLHTSIARLQSAPLAEAGTEGLFWEGALATLIQADFQKSLSDLATSNTIIFNSITPLAIGDTGGFSKVSLRVEGEAGYNTVLRYLDAVLLQEPKIGISNFNLRALPVRQDASQVLVSFQITFWAAIKVEGPE